MVKRQSFIAGLSGLLCFILFIPIVVHGGISIPLDSNVMHCYISIEEDKAILTWTKIIGATSYAIYWKEKDASYGSGIDVGDVSTYTVSGLFADKQYDFKVIAKGPAYAIDEVETVSIFPGGMQPFMATPKVIKQGDSGIIITDMSLDKDITVAIDAFPSINEVPFPEWLDEAVISPQPYKIIGGANVIIKDSNGEPVTSESAGFSGKVRPYTTKSIGDFSFRTIEESSYVEIHLFYFKDETWHNAGEGTVEVKDDGYLVKPAENVYLDGLYPFLFVFYSDRLNGPLIKDAQSDPVFISQETGSITIIATCNSEIVNTPIVAAEYYIGADPGEGNGIPMDPLDGAFDSSLESVIRIVDVDSYFPEGSFTIFIRGKNSENQWGLPSAISMNALYQSLEIDLMWNLVSLYCQPVDTAVEEIFSEYKDKVVSVWKWNKDYKGYFAWELWLPDWGEWFISYAMNKGFLLLTDISAGEGFWVNASEAFTLDVPGNSPPDLEVVCESGWNLIGLKGSESKTIADLIDGNEDQILSIWKWVADNWAVYLPSLGEATTETYAGNKGFILLEQINPGEGFWVNCEEFICLN